MGDPDDILFDAIYNQNLDELVKILREIKFPSYLVFLKKIIIWRNFDEIAPLVEGMSYDDIYEVTPLMLAVYAKGGPSQEMIWRLLKYGFNPNMFDSLGNSLIYHLIFHMGSNIDAVLKIMKLLIENGADVNKGRILSRIFHSKDSVSIIKLIIHHIKKIKNLSIFEDINPISKRVEIIKLLRPKINTSELIEFIIENGMPEFDDVQDSKLNYWYLDIVRNDMPINEISVKDLNFNLAKRIYNTIDNLFGEYKVSLKKLEKYFSYQRITLNSFFIIRKYFKTDLEEIILRPESPNLILKYKPPINAETISIIKLLTDNLDKMHKKYIKYYDILTNMMIPIVSYIKILRSKCKKKIITREDLNREIMRKVFNVYTIIRDPHELCNLVYIHDLYKEIIKKQSSKITQEMKEEISPTCLFSYEKSNEFFMRGINKLRVISLSLFRPYERSFFAKYYKGALKFTLLAKKIFPGWIVRIYYDESLLTRNYSERICEKMNEQEIWISVLDQLRKRDNVQLVKFKCPILFEKRHHTGTFGALVRMYALFDTDIEIAAFRDIDTLPSRRDYNLLMKFINSNYRVHYYKWEGYHPTWLKCSGLKEISHIVAAGVWAAKPPFDEQLWKEMIYVALNDENIANCAVDNRFGIDEAILNQFIQKNIPNSDIIYNDAIYIDSIYNKMLPVVEKYKTLPKTSEVPPELSIYSLYYDSTDLKFYDALVKILPELKLRKKQLKNEGIKPVMYSRNSPLGILVYVLLNKYRLLENEDFIFIDEFLTDPDEPMILPEINGFGKLEIPYKIIDSAERIKMRKLRKSLKESLQNY